MRIAYLSHSELPSAETNTEQLVQTLAALAGRELSIDLHVPTRQPPGNDGGAGTVIARHYGLAGGELPAGLRLCRHHFPAWLTRRAAEPINDLLVPPRVAGAGYDLYFTRDPVALAWVLARGARAVFETYRPDFATAGRYAPWRALTLDRPGLVGLVLHSWLCARAFAARGVPDERILVAHNGHAPEQLEPRIGRAEARQRLGLPASRRLAVYAGHVGPRKGTDTLADLARRLPEIDFVLVGAAGPYDPPGGGPPGSPANLRVVPRLPPPEVAPWLYAADILLIPPTADPLLRHRRTVLPMKTFLYLAAGRPIVAPATPDVAEVLEDGRNARLIEPGDFDAAERAIRGLLADPALAARLAATALGDAGRYTWAARAAAITAFLQRRMETPHP